MNKSENSLKVSHLNKTYNNQTKALDDVSLSLNNGMFGLLGPNGAGKSSLMRSIATLQSVDSGQIVFNNQDITKDPDLIRGNLGYLPQEFGVYPNVSAEKLLHYIGVLKGVLNKKQRQQQIDYLFEQTHLSKYRHQSVANYSGGMKQRFGIAQALLGLPKILIVDEPTAGLDPQECHHLHNLLCELATDRIVIFSTHIVEDVQNLCPQMAVLEAGKICFQGQPETLIQTLENKLWSKQVSMPELKAIQQRHSLLSTRLNGGVYQVRVVAQNQPEEGFVLTEADLEDSYFQLIKSRSTNTFVADESSSRQAA